MTPSITEQQPKLDNSKADSQSSFSLSDDDIKDAPQFLEESKQKKFSHMKTPSKPQYQQSSSMREVRRQLKMSMEKTKQFYNSVTQKNEVRDSIEKTKKSDTSRKESSVSRQSVSRVEYRHFRKHEFFEEKLKMQREKVKFMIEEDPESDRKVSFKQNYSFIKVALTQVHRRNRRVVSNQHSNFAMEEKRELQFQLNSEHVPQMRVFPVSAKVHANQNFRARLVFETVATVAGDFSVQHLAQGEAHGGRVFAGATPVFAFF